VPGAELDAEDVAKMARNGSTATAASAPIVLGSFTALPAVDLHVVAVGMGIAAWPARPDTPAPPAPADC
jgi:hypothetical protein